MPLTTIIPIEPGEAGFSLAIRACRVTGKDPHEVIGPAIYYDKAGLRDFPVALKRLSDRLEFQFISYRKLIKEHCSTLYFTSTIPAPFWEKEIWSSFTPSTKGLIRLSLGSGWPHLRFCSACAQAEYRAHRFAWWHRDHQLPLSLKCTAHQIALSDVTLNIPDLILPHEISSVSPNIISEQSDLDKLISLAMNLELHAATRFRPEPFKALYTATMKNLRLTIKDPFDIAEKACNDILSVVVQLENFNQTVLRDDWDRLQLSIKTLVRDGVEYADPVSLILFLVTQARPIFSRSRFWA